MKRTIFQMITAMLLIVLIVGPAWALTIDQILEASYDSTGKTLKMSLSSASPTETSALTNTAAYPLTVKHESTGTVASGIGVGIDFQQEVTASTVSAMKLAAIAADVGATHDFDFYLYLAKAGAAPTQAFRVGSTGIVYLVNNETIDNTTDGTITITAPIMVNTNSTSHTTTSPIEQHTNSTSFTVTSPTEQHTNTTSFTVTSPILAAIQGTTGGWQIKKYEATTGALSGASGSCAVNVPSGALLIGSQLRVDTLITSGDGATSWAAAYATGSTAAVTTGQAFTKSTKVNTFFDANAATAITSGTTTITVTPNSGTFSAGVVRCITYAAIFTAMADAP